MTKNSYRIGFALCIWMVVGVSQSTGAAAGDGHIDAELRLAVQRNVITDVEARNLYDKVIIGAGNVEHAVIVLSVAAADVRVPVKQRVNALRLASEFLWRNGNLKMALDVIERVSDIGRLEEFPDIIALKARLLDAWGDAEGARGLYVNALHNPGEPEGHESIRLRLAMMRVIEGDVEALVRLGSEGPGENRNRVAAILALLGHYKDALRLFQVSGQGRVRIGEQLQLAEWAIRAGDHRTAQESAWLAVRKAKVKTDRLYGLGLLLESHRLDNSLDFLIERFSQSASLSPESRQTWIDLLRETRQYDKALSLIRQNGSGEFSPTDRRQLIAVYQESGQASKVVSEYENLIGHNPGEVNWSRGLAEHYLSAGQSELAEQVWRDFLNNNASDGAILMRGFQAMAQMGFDALIVDSLENEKLALENATSMLFFVFEQHLKHGSTIDAEKTLRRIEEMSLPGVSGVLTILADAYERLDRPEKALEVWERLSKTKVGLSYGQKMRLAWLYGALNRHEQAMNTWMALRHSTTLPSRLEYIEGHVLRTAAEIGRLGDIAVELEEKLANGTANQNDGSLLVRLYTKVGDQISAVDVIEEFYADTDGNGNQRLLEQAKVFLLLGDHERYRQINRRLIDIDPNNKANYLRSIILSRLEQKDGDSKDAGRAGDIKNLLDELRQVGVGAQGWEFEAGILVQAKLFEEAVVAYRRAATISPENSDVYLSLGDLLRKEGRKSDAIAMFQYLAETAVDDNQFVVAIDGLINMVAAPISGNTATTRPAVARQNAHLLRWIRRIIMERMIKGTKGTYLYDLLADVAEEEYDAAGRISALKNSLPLAMDRRSATLRQLIILTSPKMGQFGVSTLEFDNQVEQYLGFGRRLIALGEELPPQIYIDLGKTFLDRREPDAAERAFNMANDITGRRSIREQAATSFDQAGYDRKALEQYSAALINNKGSVPIMLKYASLRERLGHDAAAHALYTEALRVLLLSQPTGVRLSPKADSTMFGHGLGKTRSNSPVTREFEAHYKDLTAGFLRTWSDNPASYSGGLEWLGAMLDDELSRVVSSVDFQQPEPQSLEYFSRLDHMARFARRVAIATGHYEYADELDINLLKQFGHDGDFAVSLVSERLEWGLRRSASDLVRKGNSNDKQTQEKLQALLRIGQVDNLSALERTLAVADNDTSFVEALGIAVLTGSGGDVLNVARAWAKFGSYSEAVTRSKNYLSKRDYENLARYVMQLIQRDENFLKEGVRSVEGLLADIEATTGQQVFSEKQIKEFFKSVSTTSQMVSNSGALFERLPQREVLKLLEFVIATKTGPESVTFAASLIPALLISPANSEYMDHAMDLFADSMGQVDANMRVQFASSMLSVIFSEAELPLENVDFARRLASAMLGTLPHETEFEPFFQLHAGEIDAAVNFFVAAYRDIEAGLDSNPAFSHMASRPYFLSKHRKVVRAKLEALVAEEGGSPELANLTYKMLYSGGAGWLSDEDGLEAFLENAIEGEPDNKDYLTSLYEIYSRRGNFRDAIGVLEILRELDPDSQKYMEALYHAWIKAGMMSKAQQLRSEYGRGLSETVSIDKIDAAAELLPLGPLQIQQRVLGDGMAINTHISGMLKAANVGDLETLKLGLRKFWIGRGVDNVPEQMSAAIGSRSSGQSVRRLLQAEWPPADSGAMAVATRRSMPEQLLMLRENSPRSRKLFDVLAGYEFSTAEYESFLRAEETNSRPQLADLYGFLAKSYQRQGTVDQKLEELTRAVDENMASFDDLTLWLTLLSESTDGPPVAAMASVNRYSSDIKSLSDYQSMLVARILATAGQHEKSYQVYRYLVDKILIASGDTTSPTLLWQLVEEIGRSPLPLEYRSKVLEKLLMLAGQSGGWLTSAYQDFVIRACGELLPVHKASAMADKYVGKPNSEWTIGNLIVFADLHARAGRYGQALTAVELSLLKERTKNMSGRAAIGDGGGVIGPRVGFISSIIRMPEGVADSDDPASLAGNLFPRAVNGWSGAEIWLLQVAASLPGWTKDAEMDQNKVLRLMSLIALRLHEAGKHNIVATLVADISTLLTADLTYPRSTIALALRVADEVASPLSLTAMQALLRSGRLEVGRAGIVVLRTFEAEGAEKALELGEAAAEYTHQESLLAALISVAEESGDGLRANHWGEELERDARARKELVGEAD